MHAPDPLEKVSFVFVLNVLIMFRVLQSAVCVRCACGNLYYNYYIACGTLFGSVYGPPLVKGAV